MLWRRRPSQRKGLFRAGVAALLACGSSQGPEVSPPPAFGMPHSAGIQSLNVGDLSFVGRSNLKSEIKK